MIFGYAEAQQMGYDTARFHHAFTIISGKPQPVRCYFLLATIAARAEDGTVQTGWMELVKGSRDSTVGAEVVEVEAGDTAGTQKITLAIPKKSIANPGDIEEVVVIGPAAGKTGKARATGYHV